MGSWGCCFACVTVDNLHANDFLFDNIFYIAKLVVVLYATHPRKNPLPCEQRVLSSLSFNRQQGLRGD
jgi:hypothetical protein